MPYKSDNMKLKYRKFLCDTFSYIDCNPTSTVMVSSTKAVRISLRSYDQICISITDVKLQISIKYMKVNATKL